MSVRKYIKQLAGESAVYGISGVIGRFISIFLVPVYTRIFTPSDYGVMSLLTVFSSLVGMFAVLALDNSSARWFYDTDDQKHQMVTISSWFWTQLTVSTLIAAAIWVFASDISVLLTDSTDHYFLVQLVGLAIPLNTGGKVLGNWLRYQRRATAVVVVSLSRTLGNIGLVVLLVIVWRYGLTGVYSAQLIISALFFIISLFFLKKWISPLLFSWNRLKPMLKYALPLIPTAIGMWIMMGMDKFMLKHFSTIHEVGLYSIATTIASGVTLVTAAFTQAWGPFAFSIFKKPDSGKVFAKVLDLYSFAGALLVTGFALFAPLILRIFTTESYYAAASTVGLLALGTLMNGARFIGSLGCGIAKKSVPTAISVAIGVVINLGLNYLLIPLIGRNGAALATMIAWAASLIYRFYASQKLYYIPYRWKTAVLPIALSLCLLIIDGLCINGNSLLDNSYRVLLMLCFIPLGLTFKYFSVADITRIMSGLKPSELKGILSEQK